MHRLGEIRARGLENQSYRASGLTFCPTEHAAQYTFMQFYNFINDCGSSLIDWHREQQLAAPYADQLVIQTFQ